MTCLRFVYPGVRRQLHTLHFRHQAIEDLSPSFPIGERVIGQERQITNDRYYQHDW
jgi:hypothetical protein